MPFAVAAGTIGRVEHADVHVLHAKVSINHSFVLGTKMTQKTQKHYDNKASFHGNKVIDKINKKIIP